MGALRKLPRIGHKNVEDWGNSTQGEAAVGAGCGFKICQKYTMCVVKKTDTLVLRGYGVSAEMVMHEGNVEKVKDEVVLWRMEED